MCISNKSLKSQIVRLQRSNVTNVFAVLDPFIKKSIELRCCLDLCQMRPRRMCVSMKEKACASVNKQAPALVFNTYSLEKIDSHEPKTTTCCPTGSHLLKSLSYWWFPMNVCRCHVNVTHQSRNHSGHDHWIPPFGHSDPTPLQQKQTRFQDVLLKLMKENKEKNE